MKILKSSSETSAKSPITAATAVGTTFYKASLDMVLKALEQDRANIWLYWSLQELGFDAIDFSHGMYGSRMLDVNGEDVLYICVTDVYDIEVNGTMENPEEVLDYYSETELAEYVKDATDKIIVDHITEHEIFTPQFDKWVPESLRAVTVLRN